MTIRRSPWPKSESPRRLALLAILLFLALTSPALAVVVTFQDGAAPGETGATFGGTRDAQLVQADPDNT